MKILDRKSFNAFFSQSRSRRNRKRASAGSAGLLGCPAQRKLPTTDNNTAEKKPETAKKTIEAIVSKEKGDLAMTTAQILVQQGMQQGMQRGNCTRL